MTLLHGPVPRQAGYSVLGGAAEASAISWRVFDPTVSEHVRVQRGFEERLHSIYSQRDLAPQSVKEIEKRRAAVVADAARFGLQEQPDSRKTGLPHIGKARPQIQDLLTRILPSKPAELNAQTQGEFLWRSLSAWSHSKLWTNAVGPAILEDDTQPRSLTVNIPILMVMCTLTVKAFDAAFSRRMRLAGHLAWEQQRGALPTFGL